MAISGITHTLPRWWYGIKKAYLQQQAFSNSLHIHVLVLDKTEINPNYCIYFDTLKLIGGQNMPYLNKPTPKKEPIDCRILTAALNLFVEHGFHKVSVHHVQRQADVSIGSIYNHFGSKEGIARALYYHLLNEFEQIIEEVVSQDLSCREQCNKIIALLFKYTETKSTIISYMLHAKHREFLPNEPSLCSSTPFTGMRNIVKRGIETGEIRPGDPYVVTSIIFGGAIRMIHLRLDGIINKPLPKYYDEVVSCVWQGLAHETISDVSKVASAI